MKTLLTLVAFAGLALMFAGAILLFAGRVERGAYDSTLLVGTALWFVTVPFWMRRRLHHSED